MIEETENHIALYLDPEKIINAYDKLIVCALFIVNGAPYWSDCYEEDRAWLTINGDIAILSWPKIERGYEDSCSIEIDQCAFDKHFLSISNDDLKKWKTEQRAKYNQEQKQDQERRKNRQEAEMRLQYELLKAHFEKKHDQD